MVKRVLGDASERKIQQIPLSNDTVKWRINEMSDDLFLTRMKKIVCLTHYLKTKITQYLRSLESEPNMYFPAFEEEEGKLVRTPFSGTLDITTIPSDVQDDFLDLKYNSAAKDLHEDKSLNVFWCSMHHSHPKVSEIVLRLLLPFSTTDLCESGFSTRLQIKNKNRNRLDVDPNMRYALSVTQPRIHQLTEKKHYQPSY
ncbi:zinc finger BED domain-containing protein 5-like [Palaemon carinicauda]|uniref:zinc finger BED domain-containing protein 5-like n=1 Tax=Palaemon carinicauda TaxID=392227 RepID=UPI0035B66413